VPQGPIRILGFSIGGHFGYAAALALQERGREIASFCAIDSFIIPPFVPRSRVRNAYRVLARAFGRLCKGQFGELSRSVRLRLYRTMIRSAGDRLPALLLGPTAARRLPIIFRHDQLLGEEVTTHLLIRQGQPWAKSLDVDPLMLKVPAILFRTPETAGDDEAWRRRCPGVEVFEIPGDHWTLTDTLENSRNPETIFASKTSGAIRERFLNTMRG
jgi:thioesterase domain-containing protein